MTEEEKDYYRKNIVWKPYNPYGGQQVGVQTVAILSNEELGIEIKIEQSRSQTENRRICLELYEEFLNKIR